MISMKHHEEIRKIFIKNRIKPSDGRSIEELSDEEIEELFNKIIHLMTEMVFKLRTYIDKAAEDVADFNKAWEESVMRKK